MAQVLTQATVENWLKLVSGAFKIRDIWSELGIESPEGKQHLRVILFRAEEKGLIVCLGNGIYRKLDSERKPQECKRLTRTKLSRYCFPLGLRNTSVFTLKVLLLLLVQSRRVRQPIFII